MTSNVKKPGLGGRAFSGGALPVNPSTHQGRVLEALRQGPKSAAELQWSLRIAHAPSAVRELIDKGHRIETRPDTSPQGRQIKRYNLIESE